MSKSLPKITVVTPSFNQAHFLERTIKSVLDQNYENLEYIVIDGGSTDGSVEIIKSYEKSISHWVSEKDRGQSHAINKGFQKATGQILCWLNSDDMFLPGTLHFVGNYFNEHRNVDCVYGDTVCIDQDEKEILKRHELSFQYEIILYSSNYIPQSSTFWRRELFESLGGLNEELHYTMDHEYWLRMGKNNYRIEYVPRFLSLYRWHGSSKGNIASPQIRVEQRWLRKTYSGHPVLRFLGSYLNFPLKMYFKFKRQFIKIFIYGRMEFVPANLYRWYLKFVAHHF